MASDAFKESRAVPADASPEGLEVARQLDQMPVAVRTKFMRLFAALLFDRCVPGTPLTRRIEQIPAGPDWLADAIGLLDELEPRN
jgi:hypothetical protein